MFNLFNAKKKLESARSIKEFIRVLLQVESESKDLALAVNSLNKSLSSTRSLSGVSSRSKIVISLSGDDDGVFEIDRGGSDPVIPKGKARFFKKPNIKKLLNIFTPIKRTYGILKFLRQAEVSLENLASSYPDNPEMRRDIAKARIILKRIGDNGNKSIQEGFEFLNSLANERPPHDMKNVAERIKSVLEDVLDEDNYKSIQEKFYVVPVEKPGNKKYVHYCHYILIDGLKDIIDFEYPTFSFVLTGEAEVTQGGAIDYYLNTLYEFEIPGSYPVGDPLGQQTKSVLTTKIKNMLTAVKVLPAFETHSLDVNDNDLYTLGLDNLEGVQGINVTQDGKVAVTLESLEDDHSEAEVNAIIHEVISRFILGLKTLIDDSGKKTIKFSAKPNRNGNLVITFMLAKSTDKKSNIVSDQAIDRIVEEFNLSDNTRRELRRFVMMRKH